MSEPTDKDAHQDPAVDIFAMKPSAQPDAAAAGVRPDPGPTPAKVAGSTRWTSKLGPVHFGAAVLLAAGAWIAWPYVFDGSRTNGQPAIAPGMLVPEQPGIAATSELHRTAAVASTADSRAAAPEAPAAPVATPEASAAPAPAPGPVTPAQPSPIEADLQAKISDLQEKLASAEARAAVCPAVTPAKLATVYKPTHKPAHAGSARKRDVPANVETAAGDAPQLREFTLNTIYRGQAWIQSAQGTPHVVQAGDVVDGVRIVRVEPRARQVVTSRGVIR